MQLERFQIGNTFMIRPVNPEDKVLFRHCAGGADEVSEQEEAEVTELLFAHGVEGIMIKDVFTHDEKSTFRVRQHHEQIGYD